MIEITENYLKSLFLTFPFKAIEDIMADRSIAKAVGVGATAFTVVSGTAAGTNFSDV